MVVALVEAVLPHQRREMLQTVGMTLTGRDVQQVVPILIPDQLQVICCQVRLQEEEEKKEQEEVEEKREEKEEVDTTSHMVYKCHIAHLLLFHSSESFRMMTSHSPAKRSVPL